MSVKCEYDPEAKAMYFTLPHDPLSKVLTTEEAEDGILLDFNQHADVMGVEILSSQIPDSLPVVAARAEFAEHVAAIYRSAVMATSMTMSPGKFTKCEATA